MQKPQYISRNILYKNNINPYYYICSEVRYIVKEYPIIKNIIKYYHKDKNKATNTSSVRILYISMDHIIIENNYLKLYFLIDFGTMQYITLYKELL